MILGEKKKRKTDTFEILDKIPYEEYVTTSEVSKKLNQDWVMVLRRLFYLEFRGYVKFIEVRNNKAGFASISYAWKRLKEDEPKNTSLSKSFMELLEFVPDDEFISTNRLSKVTKENNMVTFAKLLYLESRRKVVCFRAGPKSQVNRTHHWKKLSDTEKEEMKDYDWEKIEKRYEKECFKYSE
jgi:hypothetical protein